MALDPEAVTDADAASRSPRPRRSGGARRSGPRRPAPARGRPTDGAAGGAARPRPGADRGRSRSVWPPSAPPRARTSPTRCRSCAPAWTGELVPSPAALELADQLAALEADLRRHVRCRHDVRRAGGRTRPSRRRAPGAARGGAGRPQPRARSRRRRASRAGARRRARRPSTRPTVASPAGGPSDASRRRATRSRRSSTSSASRSYSDYMMGYSLLNVDPEKEAALDAARAELSAAEDEWQRLEAETDAELARAERMERRRLLLDDAARAARAGRWRPASAVDELRALRVPATHPARAGGRRCSAASTRSGSPSATRTSPATSCMLLAEAWLAEADDSTDREQRAAPRARRPVGGARSRRSRRSRPRRRGAVALDGPPPEEERQARLDRAESGGRAGRGRRRRHLEAEAAVAAMTAELAAAVEAERLAADAGRRRRGRGGRGRRSRRSSSRPSWSRIAEELEALSLAEIDANEHLQSLVRARVRVAGGAGPRAGRRRGGRSRRRTIALRVAARSRCRPSRRSAPRRRRGSRRSRTRRRAARRAARSPRRSSGTSSPGWPPSGRSASVARCRCCSTTPSTGSTRTSSATSSGGSSAWPTPCR